MNRANFGNVITNGMQILSVGATTAGHVIGSADKVLNNKNKKSTETKQPKQSKQKEQKPVQQEQTVQEKFQTVTETPQSENLNTRINSDADWLDEYVKEIQNKPSEIKKLGFDLRDITIR